MKFDTCLVICAVWLGSAAHSLAAESSREWSIDGTKRIGVICIPGNAVQRPEAGWPTVFVFHGHGGTSANIRRQFRTDTIWPGAVVVYLQGLPTVGPLTDPQGKETGWDSAAEPEKNKDLRLYDIVLKDLIDHEHIDPKRVFSTGHSNGGGFTFTLWARRSDTLAAIAESSSIAVRKDWPLLKAKPALMSAGRNDPLVKFSWQSQMVDRLKLVNGVSGNGKAWGTDGTWYTSEGGTPLVTIIHDGTHTPPKDLGERIVEFFKTVSPGVVK